MQAALQSGIWADPVVVATAFGGSVVESASLPGPASHDGRGRRFVLVPEPGDPATYALDVEPRDGSMPAGVAAALGTCNEAEAFRRWTELEVEAKLDGTPVLLLLKGVAPRSHSVTIVRADTAQHWIAIGRRP